MIRRPLITYAIKVKLKRVLDLTDRSVIKALGTTYEGIKFKSHEQPDVANLLIWTDNIKSPSYIEVVDDTKTLRARLP